MKPPGGPNGGLGRSNQTVGTKMWAPVRRAGKLHGSKRRPKFPLFNHLHFKSLFKTFHHSFHLDFPPYVETDHLDLFQKSPPNGVFYFRQKVTLPWNTLAARCRWSLRINHRSLTERRSLLKKFIPWPVRMSLKGEEVGSLQKWDVVMIFIIFYTVKSRRS